MVSPAARTHEHRLAEPKAWPWLPTTRGGPIVQHPYCADCGSIKSIGSDRAMDLGGLMNLMGRLRRLLEARGHRLTEVQRRLITQRLEAINADDRFAQSRTNQYALMAECVGRATGIPTEVVHSYLHHC